jgi:diaminobutyrate-2-oxoglutarate transaminase
MATENAVGIPQNPLAHVADAQTFELYESNVRLYCRSFPAIFHRAEGPYLYDHDGKKWLDFFCAASSLNYGHNHPALKRALLQYIEEGGVVNTLDLHTTAKESFLTELNDTILKPRGLNYRCQFCGPTGTNAVEAALKLVRKATGRRNIVSFSGSYHGLSAGSLAISSLVREKNEPYLESSCVTLLPYEGFTDLDNEFEWIRSMLTTKGSGILPPAAFIVEMVQCEGGVNMASTRWVRELHKLATELGALFIVDDIQAGCGRTGQFFSFERHGIVPDIVCLSKSISAFGFPMSLLLINPALDIWSPGEHTGTFRGFNYAFVTGAAAMRHFWQDPQFLRSLDARSGQMKEFLDLLAREFQTQIPVVRHVGMVAGIKLPGPEFASRLLHACRDRALMVETVGPGDDTLKLLPPLTVSREELDTGLNILWDAFIAVSRS